MTKIKPLLWAVLFMLVLYSCKKGNPLYDRPEWLAGKVYTQILEYPELSTFADAIKRIEYDQILDVSGSYTVFAPSNDAFASYFASNSKYSSIDDIPLHELERMVKFHIIQNPWSKVQLRTLDIYGWIDTLDINNNEAKGFKRATLLLEDDRKYGVESLKDIRGDSKAIIVDTLETSWHRKAATDTRKFAPIFYQEYFNIYDLKKSDYEFYFDRPFEGGNDIHFAGAKITSDEIFAENGFIYVVDRVVEPLKNAYQMISDPENTNDYSDFLKVVNLFPDFEYNEEKTNNQPGADLGLKVDSLFELKFPDLTFDVTSEKTSPPAGTYGLPQNVTIRYHHGMLAPNNQAFQNFIDNYIKVPGGWGTLEGTPEFIKRIIANTYMSINTIYPSDLEKGFYNGELDIVKIDEGEIIEKEFGSNSTFIGLKEAIVPRAFKSVTGPIYLRRGYAKIMYAIEKSGLLPALKRENKDYMLFVESDANTSLDSSLMYNPIKDQFSVIQRLGGGMFQEFPLNMNDLRTLLLNQIAVEQPKGQARKEFILNLAGNLIMIDNETGEVSGTAPTTDGYNGFNEIPEFPSVLSDQVDNGTTYDVQNWFSFSSASLFLRISTAYPKFHNLMRKAGLSIDKEYRYNFISDNDFYTVFVPTEAALDSARLDTLPVDQLKNVMLLHFVQGDMIFTDGKRPSQYYETARVDEKSTTYTKVFTKIFVEPQVDNIVIKAKDGSTYANIPEAEDITNIVTGVNLGEGQEVFPVLYNNGVIHEVDKVLILKELDTN